MERKLSAQQSERDFDKRHAIGDMTKLFVAQIRSRTFSHQGCIPWRIVYLLPVSANPCHFRCPFRRSEEPFVAGRILLVVEVLHKMCFLYVFIITICCARYQLVVNMHRKYYVFY